MNRIAISLGSKSYEKGFKNSVKPRVDKKKKKRKCSGGHDGKLQLFERRGFNLL